MGFQSLLSWNSVRDKIQLEMMDICIFGFNPYYPGIQSETIYFSQFMFCPVCFNPYYPGIQSETWDDQLNGPERRGSFNPYYPGIQSETHPKDKLKNKQTESFNPYYPGIQSETVSTPGMNMS